ncbi:MAG: glycosyltransferase family 9 protein [Acidobacteriia bacterium]|nr:glycosyltransferase family 9 protein [Terriglobia bacterium]
MFTAGKPAKILVVRLGAMGDIIHALPAAASLKHSYPGSHLTWIVEPKWAPLLAGNPFVDRIALFSRERLRSLLASWRSLRAARYDFAVDFQGLVKSALVASAARPERIFGFHHTQVRERAAALFYSNKTLSHAVHVVDKNLDLARSAGAANILRTFPLPAGCPEGDLPAGDFVLASPTAGWRAKQWPADAYRLLALHLRRELSIPLVLNAPPGAVLPEIEGALPHFSGLPGLIFATRRAAAVLGVDSGPLHLAAALCRPGVAIFGPTDPARNGPYGESLKVLRSPTAQTTYKRGDAIDESMRQVTPGEVFEALRAVLGERRPAAGCVV